MITYSKFRPTGLDCPGLALADRQDWLVVPCSRNRDSGPLGESNFVAALKILGGESETVEVHSFNHWACGRFEIILAHPSLTNQVEELEERLENYPLLDEEDFSDRELREYLSSWGAWGAREFVRHLADKYQLSSNVEDFLSSCSTDSLRELYESGVSEPYCGESSGVRIPIKNFFLERSELAQWIKAQRKAGGCIANDPNYEEVGV